MDAAEAHRRAPDDTGRRVALGRAVVIRRVELGLTRKELASAAGLSYPYLAEIERGAKRPSARVLDALAAALHLRPAELLDRAAALEERPEPGTVGAGDTAEPAAAPPDVAPVPGGAAPDAPAASRPPPSAPMAPVVSFSFGSEPVPASAPPPASAPVAAPGPPSAPAPVPPPGVTPAGQWFLHGPTPAEPRPPVSDGAPPAGPDGRAKGVDDLVARVAEQLHRTLRDEVHDLVVEELEEAARQGALPPPEPLTEPELRSMVLETVAAMIDGDEVQVDPEGDIPMRKGEVMLFVRVVDEPLAVLVFSPLLIDLPESAVLLDRLNQLNSDLHFVRVCHTNDGVVADLELFGEWYRPEWLAQACDAISAVAGDLGPALQAEFGGRLFLEEGAPAVRQGTGGYL